MSVIREEEEVKEEDRSGLVRWNEVIKQWEKNRKESKGKKLTGAKLDKDKRGKPEIRTNTRTRQRGDEKERKREKTRKHEKWDKKLEEKKRKEEDVEERRKEGLFHTRMQQPREETFLSPSKRK